MHEFLHQQNVACYRKLLAEATNKSQRYQLLKLLAEEEASERKHKWSSFARQPGNVDSPMRRTSYHEDAETVCG